MNISRLPISSIVLFFVCLGITAGAASITPADAFEADIDQMLDGLEQGSGHVTALPSRRADGGRVTLELTVPGRLMRLELAPINVFAPGATVVHVTDQGSFEEPATADTYRGVVSGVAGSVVAVSLDGGIPEGLVLVGDDLYLIEPASRSNGAAAAGELTVLHGSAARLGLAAGPRGPGAGTVPRATPLNLLEIAAVGDFEYFQLWGSNATAQIASVINQVDAVYTSEIETTIQILTTMVFETAADPFSVFNSGSLFNDFKNTASEFGAWRAGQSGDLRAAGLGHLFSNKFAINAGFGFTNVLCNASKGASITTTNFPSLHPLLIEHEFGHNFGSPHDGEGACASSPGGFIMAPSATGTQFSTCSKTIMRFNRDRASCITQVAAQVCGDGIITDPEVCDDGADNGSGDGFCLNDCSAVQTCGDGVANGGEVCDDGVNNARGSGFCLADCSAVQACGDASADGTLAATDALLALVTAVGGGTTCQTCVCDVNRSSAVTATDALLILQRSVGQSVNLSCSLC